jgi:hypothetical protein
MTDAELQAFADRIAEQPIYRRGGAINFVGTESEYRAKYLTDENRFRQQPTLSKGPKPLEYRRKKKRRRPNLAEQMMQLDMYTVRAQTQDRELRELGIL